MREEANEHGEKENQSVLELVKLRQGRKLTIISVPVVATGRVRRRIVEDSDQYKT